MNKLPLEAALVVNVASRTGERQFATAKELLRAAGVKLVQTHAAKTAASLEKAVNRAVAKGVPLVIIGGGDGTISLVSKLLIGTKTALAVLPLGTANSFARALGIPLQLSEAVNVILEGRITKVDLGKVGDHHFAGCASIGLAPQIARSVPAEVKAWGGRLGYLVWASIQFGKFNAFSTSITVDGKTKSMEAVEIRIANGGFHGGVELVESASLRSGQIVVQVVLGRRRRDLLRDWAGRLAGARKRQKRTMEFCGSRIEVATSPVMNVSIDGEVLSSTPVLASVRAKAISVIAPR